MDSEQALRSRAFTGPVDLRRMQEAVAGAFACTSVRVGDLAWLTRQKPLAEHAEDIRLWEERDGTLAAWAFVRADGGFNLFIDPRADAASLAEELLDWVERVERRLRAAGPAPARTYTYGIDTARSDTDRALAAALRRRGFTVGTSGGLLVRALDDLPPAVPPEGYRLAALRPETRIEDRVAAGRAAFPGSTMTVDTYRRARATWPYRSDLDRVVLADDGHADGDHADDGRGDGHADDGRVVAFALAWLDERNRSGLLEPVGVHPAHQRRGLGSAVCLDALHALRAAGAREAEVAYDTPAAEATYRRLGFTLRWSEDELERPSSGPGAAPILRVASEAPADR